jgi:hypothetical protein
MLLFFMINLPKRLISPLGAAVDPHGSEDI